MKILAYLLISAALMTSCKVSTFKDGIKGNGNMLAKEIAIDDYNGIVVQDMFDIVYTQKADKKPYLLLEIDENLIDDVSVRVEDGKLTIKETQKINPKHYKIYTNSTSLSEISASGINNIVLKDSIYSENLRITSSGVGLIDAQNLHCSNLSVDMSGVADINLAGETSNSQMSVSGKANINAYELKAKNADCSISGMGHIHVYASEKLAARVSGIGKIRYKGEPKEKNVSKSGIGSIKAKKD